MDAVDFAQKSNEVYLDAALKIQRAKAKAEVPHNPAHAGRTCCLDCGEEINPKRLAANPEAVRCIACQKIKERGNGNGFV